MAVKKVECLDAMTVGMWVELKVALMAGQWADGSVDCSAGQMAVGMVGMRVDTRDDVSVAN